MKAVALAVAVFGAAVLAPVSAASTALRTGDWFGDVSAVSVSHRTFEFRPACRSTAAGRWVDAPHVTATVRLAKDAALTIYYRPNRKAAAGHPQNASLALFASVANGKPSPDFPRGWAVTFEDGVAVIVEESSGISDGRRSCLTRAMAGRR